MQLRQGTFLQGGKYRIVSTLGQGGFGITYLAEQTSLGRKVALKEFFMKELCNRDEATSHVSVPSEGSREMVGKFREKFVKEARNIAKLEHPNIVSVIDVFEENGTAYYVMKYCDGGSLAQLLKTQYPSGMPEALALKYIREVASALDYIHQRKMNHLDVKPGNIMLNESEHAVLIDFGLSKQYDAETGQQTSTTPVGISEGYAPMEQYKKGGVGQFSPSTDIYALGATLYKLLTGQTPPDASTVNEDGLPSFQASESIKMAVLAAMRSRRADRPQTISAWVELLNNNQHTHVEESEITIITTEETKKPETPKKPEAPNKQEASNKPDSKPKPEAKSSSKKPLIIAALIAVVGIALGVVLFGGKEGKELVPEPTPAIEVIAEAIPAETNSLDPAPALDSALASTKVEVEAAGYDVTFTCNVPSATLYIDNKSVGSASDTHFLNIGTHNVKVTAEGYEDYTNKITVNSQTKPQKIKMTEDPIYNKPSVSVSVGEYRNGHYCVDLGLPSGTLWATCNVGADSPEEYGEYFAWGETEPKKKYNGSTLKYCSYLSGVHKECKFEKYVTFDFHGHVDGKTELDKSDDPASVNWNYNWRTPSEDQLSELQRCEWVLGVINGHLGYKIIGPNGNSIFLPCAGRKWENHAYRNNSSAFEYMSRSISTSIDNVNCYSLSYNGQKVYSYGIYSGREYGRTVRPVLDL